MYYAGPDLRGEQHRVVSPMLFAYIVAYNVYTADLHKILTEVCGTQQAQYS